MGCAASGASRKKDGVRLTSTKLAFTDGQLCNLNAYFRKLLHHQPRDDPSDDSVLVEARVERLLQRLLLATGKLDRRFSALYLVSLNEPRRVRKQLKFDYLVRLDALSTPRTSPRLEISRVSVEEEDAAATSPGFIRLKILGAGAEVWRECMDVAGRLRRDLVKGKLANLLAGAIKRDAACANVDDEISVSPGQVVDAEVLDKILKQPDHCRLFYGPADADDPLPVASSKKHRVALIEDTGGILLRIGFDGLAGAREVEVRLVIGIAISSWPISSDYPQRIPLYHCDALLHYSAAQTGMYAVAVGPWPGARCENRPTLWGVRVPAAEKMMSKHYAVDSVPGLTDAVLLEILYELREGCTQLDAPSKSKVARKGGARSSRKQDRLRVVSRHILRTVHRWSLERAGPDPLTSWAPDTLSRHVLLALDELVAALKRQNLRCYFHPRCNVMLQCARGGVAHGEDAYSSDSRVLESYLETLHYRSTFVTRDVPGPLDVMETGLIVRWRDILASLPGGTSNEDYGYNRRQLEYFSLILEQVLRARDASLPDRTEQNFPEPSYGAATSHGPEDLVFLLKLILTQARDRARGMRGRKLRAYRRRKESGWDRDSFGRFDYSTGLLLDVVGTDRETANADFKSLPALTRMLLHWLHFAMDYDRKILEPILRPYLSDLFNGLHEYSWCASSWRRKQEMYASEMRSLSAFCESVITGQVSAANGLVEHLSDGCYWAESMTRMIERSRGNSLPLIFHGRDKTIRCRLTFNGNRGPGSFSAWSKARCVSGIARRKRWRTAYSGAGARVDQLYETLSNRRGTPGGSKGVAGHAEHRDASPLTYVASIVGSRPRQRGPGDLVSAVVSLGKFQVLREVAALLPREERAIVLHTVHHLARESSRAARRTIPAKTAPDSAKQIYRARSEPEIEPTDTSPRLIARDTREQRIVAEHQAQLEREIQEMHDTLRRDALMRRRARCIWDSPLVSASSRSSFDSIAGTLAPRKYRPSIREGIEGDSAAPAPIAGIGADRCRGRRNEFAEMISREESPAWSTLEARRKLDDAGSRNEDESPSWDALEATLNRRLGNYVRVVAGSCQDLGDGR